MHDMVKVSLKKLGKDKDANKCFDKTRQLP